jgi:hypothetical protein
MTVDSLPIDVGPAQVTRRVADAVGLRVPPGAGVDVTRRKGPDVCTGNGREDGEGVTGPGLEDAQAVTRRGVLAA